MTTTKSAAKDVAAATVVARATGAGARPTARERLLAAANELFYREGVQSVGIDRIIEHAGVAKASLYNTYGNKEGLVRAYLESRHERSRRRITRVLSGLRTPRERLLGVFDAQSELFTEPEFNGCAFVSATAETHGASVERAAVEYRSWLESLLTDLAAEAGAADPATLARQIHMLYDGSTLSARMDGDRTAASIARAAASALLDAALPASAPAAGL